MTMDPDPVISPWTDHYQLWQSNDNFQGRAGRTYESMRWALVYRQELKNRIRRPEINTVQKRKDKKFDLSIVDLIKSENKQTLEQHQQDDEAAVDALRSYSEFEISDQSASNLLSIDTPMDDQLMSTEDDPSFLKRTNSSPINMNMNMDGISERHSLLVDLNFLKLSQFEWMIKTGEKIKQKKLKLPS
eukprot:GHVH01005140.1.p1 GENE.GHVH01005140.1~~GHVH01005140.1.p1  ORF type:complete len:188 (+),score=27.75 GHVH01005140.1:334-897(+)